jgi:hypothetical protein
MIQVTRTPENRRRHHLDHGPAWALTGGGVLYAAAASLTRPLSDLATAAWLGWLWVGWRLVRR